MEVQVFGVRKSADTRAALRFFAERRIRTHFVDLAERGLGTALYGDEKWLDVLADEPLLLRMPLVRSQNKLTIGPAEPTWTEWLASA